jgi:uncharacterized membrane protein (UPF0127 family)
MNKNSLTKYLILLSVITVFAASCSARPAVAPASPTVNYNYTKIYKVGGQNLQIEIADTPKKMATGLSGRLNLNSNQGMLFDFKNEKVFPKFWMKDMNFNLDLIWIDGEKIVGITPNVPAPSKDQRLKIKDADIPSYSPPKPIDQVLEVNAGWCEKNKIKIGDEVKKLNYSK